MSNRGSSARPGDGRRGVDPDPHPGDRVIYQAAEQLIEAGARGFASALLKVVRYRRRNDPVQVTHAPIPHPELPGGPFVIGEADAAGDLLIFVPRNIISRMIDDATGRYGYSHVAIDCGEVDQPTGMRVMIESTVHAVVHRSFQNEYGPRPYVRIRLSAAGIDGEAFCTCVRTKLGEPYDNAEALTWGEVDDPAKQVCSDLATVCLPYSIRAEIADQRIAGRLSRGAVSVHHRAGHDLDVFVSPNGFCEFFGAPRGEDLVGPDQYFEPRISPLPVNPIDR